MIVVLIHRPDRGTWCVLRCAHPGARITTLCCSAFDYQHVNLATVDLADHDARMPTNTCPACQTELAMRTPGAAEAIDDPWIELGGEGGE